MTVSSGLGRGSVAVRAGGAIIALAGIGYLVAMLIRQPLESMDFRYVWLAGDLWGRGENPYGPGYIAEGAGRFPTGYAISSWAYPFHWYLPARLAALLPPEPAFAWWLVATTLALAGAGWLALAAARAAGAAPLLALVLIGIGYAASGSFVGYALRTGQPAVVAECGVAMVLFGFARGRRWWTVCGLAVAMLKPQLGLPLATALCFMPGGFVSALLAALLVALASVPAFLASGLTEQLHGLLVVSSGAYQKISYNTAEMMSGLPHLGRVATGWSMPIVASMLLAMLLTAGAAWAIRRHRPRERAALFAALTTTIIAAVVGFHTYDLVIVLFALPLVPLLARPARIAALVAYALLWRPDYMIHALAGGTALTPTVQSLALVLLMGVWVHHAVHRPRVSMP